MAQLIQLILSNKPSQAAGRYNAALVVPDEVVKDDHIGPGPRKGQSHGTAYYVHRPVLRVRKVNDLPDSKIDQRDAIDGDKIIDLIPIPLESEESGPPLLLDDPGHLPRRGDGDLGVLTL